jgi:hypothetical protein
MARRRERRPRRYRRAAGGRRRGGELGLVGWLGLPGRSGLGGLARPAWPLEAGWAGSATRPIGPKVEEDFFFDKKLIFEFTKALEICRRRFRRNFEVRIFPKFF